MTVGKVKRIISAELKFTTTNAVDTVVNTANPYVENLTAMAQGNTSSQRDGNRINGVNVHGNITLNGEDAGVDEITPVRITIFRWNEDASVTVPTPALIMQDVAQLGGAYNINNRGFFKVLYSRFFTLVNSNDNVNFKKTLRFYTKLSGKIIFDGGLVTDLKKFHIYIMIQATSTVATHPVLNSSITFRYTDS